MGSQESETAYFKRCRQREMSMIDDRERSSILDHSIGTSLPASFVARWAGEYSSVAKRCFVLSCNVIDDEFETYLGDLPILLPTFALAFSYKHHTQITEFCEVEGRPWLG